MESECVLPPPRSHSDSETPLRPAPTHVGLAVHGVPRKPVLRHTPRCTATPRSIYHLGSGDGNILPHPPALVIGPTGNTGLLFNTDPREELDLSNDGLYQNPAGPSSGLLLDQFRTTGPPPPVGPGYDLPQSVKRGQARAPGTARAPATLHPQPCTRTMEGKGGG